MASRSLTALALLLALPSFARAQDAADPQLAAVNALQARIEQLERENQTLRMQWGQATMEVDRLRAELTQLRASTAAASSPGAVTPAAPPRAAPPDDESTPVAEVVTPTPEPATQEVQWEGDAEALRAEVERLRRENENLRTQKDELTELAGVTPEGELVPSQDSRINTVRAADGQAFTRTQPQQLRVTRGSRADHYLSLGYAERPAESAPVITGFIQTRYSGGIYSDDSKVTFLLDGERYDAPIKDHAVSARHTGMAGKRRIDKSDETLAFTIEPELLRRLARATRAEGRIGEVRFELSRDDVAMFKAVQSRIEHGL